MTGHTFSHRWRWGRYGGQPPQPCFHSEGTLQRQLGRLPRQVNRWGKTALLGSTLALLAHTSVGAAEKLSFQYGLLQRSLDISSLESFAETGTPDEDLRYYFGLIGATETEKDTFRQALQTSADVDPLLVSRFLYSDFGEIGRASCRERVSFTV